MSLTNYNFDSFTISLYMDEQEDWLAYFQEMPNISAFGDTPQEALEELKTAWELTKEYYLSQGLSIPFLRIVRNFYLMHQNDQNQS